MDKAPLPNKLSLEQDASYATKLMNWQRDLERAIKRRTTAQAIFHPDPLRSNLLQCTLQINHATEMTIREVFYYDKNDQLCLPI